MTSRNRLQVLGDSARKRKWLVPFLTAGYPSIAATLELSRAAIGAGADMLELGIPFSDPLADGPAIQFASHHSLTSGMTLTKLFELTVSIRSETTIPILFMGYINPILSYGVEKFVLDAANAGVDGLIVPDLPLEESEELQKTGNSAGLSVVQLVAPTSPMSRVKKLAAASPDLLYAVTIAGVTGARTAFSDTTVAYLERIAASARGPVVAGFGVSTPESATRLAKKVDGVVVGSAIVESIQSGKNLPDQVRNVSTLLSSLRSALDRVPFASGRRS